MQSTRKEFLEVRLAMYIAMKKVCHNSVNFLTKEENKIVSKINKLIGDTHAELKHISSLSYPNLTNPNTLHLN